MPLNDFLDPSEPDWLGLRSRFDYPHMLSALGTPAIHRMGGEGGDAAQPETMGDGGLGSLLSLFGDLSGGQQDGFGDLYNFLFRLGLGQMQGRQQQSGLFSGIEV